jgi:hypothetical protein
MTITAPAGLPRWANGPGTWTRIDRPAWLVREIGSTRCVQVVARQLDDGAWSPAVVVIGTTVAATARGAVAVLHGRRWGFLAGRVRREVTAAIRLALLVAYRGSSSRVRRLARDGCTRFGSPGILG